MTTKAAREFAAIVVADTTAALTPLTDPVRAADMRRYMKDVAPYLGIGTPERRQVMRPYFKAWGPRTQPEIEAAVVALWNEPEREFAYVACDWLAKQQQQLGANFVDGVGRWLLTTTPWWDTVDALGSAWVTPVVARHQELVPLMWKWLRGDNMWLTRAALQHQRGLRTDTDVERLVAMCDERSRDTEFFIAKAVGWALRDLTAIDRLAADAFLNTHPELSSVAKRELVRGLSR